MFAQELIRHTKIELVADTILVEVEGVIAIRESDALDVDAGTACLLDETVRRLRRDRLGEGSVM